MEQSNLQTELLSLLERAEGPYRRALTMIQNALPQANPTAEEISLCLSRLDPLMKQAQEIEIELAPCRERWLAMGFQADSHVKVIFQRHEQLLTELVHKINSMEHQMQQHRQATLPQVDALVRHQQMQKAYQQVIR
ncbi:hypothetical protein [Planctomicrobium sp. SH527]|uniref:hypothetical protein n=1 Tax=Planctomicrobium sp. SH527 TaxID=3448123 RepID=UPI003F5C13F9